MDHLPLHQPFVKTRPQPSPSVSEREDPSDGTSDASVALTVSGAPTFLDVMGTAAELQAMGIPASEHAVRRWARSGTLPFCRLGRKLWISREALHGALRHLQLVANRNAAGGSGRARRRR